jgi:Flp pilus assembly protein TadD
VIAKFGYPDSTVNDDARDSAHEPDLSEANGLLRNPAVVIAGLAVLVYAVTLWNGLIYDDAALIPHHEALRGPWDLASIFTGRYWGQLHELDTLYRPLVIWSLALNVEFNRALGLNFDSPGFFHAVNISLHAIVSALVYPLARRLGLPARGALAAGLIFAVHPIHTEAVASVVNRSELMSACFGLGFLIIHLSGRRHVWAMLCLTLALFSKESALAWLPLALWLDLYLGHRAWFKYLGYAAVTFFWFGLRSMAIEGSFQDVPFADNPLVTAELHERLLTAIRVQFDYLQLQAWPVGLSADYSTNQIPIVTSLLEPRVLGFGLVLGSLGYAAWQLRRSLPLLGVSLVGYAILMSTTANILFPTGTIMGERLVYAPSVFTCLLLGMLLGPLRKRFGRATLFVAPLLIFVLAGMSVRRNLDWVSTERFSLALLRSAPNSTKAHFGVAHDVYYPAGNLEATIHHYLRAIEIYPGYADAWNNLGTAYFERGDLPAAAEAYANAAQLRPGHLEANANLGMILHRQGDFDGARRVYEIALESSPDQPQILTNLAQLYIENGMVEKARPFLQKVLWLDPDDARAHEILDRLDR